MYIVRRTNPLTLVAAVITLYLTASSEPWWNVTGSTNQILSVQVSPFYLHTTATGLVSTVGFSELLGPLTRLWLIVAFLVLGMSSLSPSAWWHEIAVYFSLSAMVELYFSFLLGYHATETLLLGAYGVIPPYTGTSNLPAVIVGLDLKTYVAPLVTAGFNLPFYVGFFGLGALIASLILKQRATLKTKDLRGVEAIFSSESE